MRFTLKTLLTAISVAAVLCCIFFTLPSIVAVVLLGLIWLLLPPALIAGIVYGRGYGRAFSIGCVAAGGVSPLLWAYSLMMFVGVVSDLDSIDTWNEAAIGVKLAVGATCLLMGLSGLSSMTVRWMSLRLAAAPPAAAPTPTPLPAHYSVLQRRVSMQPPNPTSTDGDGAEPST